MTFPNDDINIRFATEDDLQAVYENQADVYGITADPQDVEAWKRRVELEDILVAEDISDPRHPFVVGTSLYYKQQLTVPGGATLDAAWLAMIAVAPTHQGQRVWQQLSTKGFEILLERKCPILCGVPTQPTVYEILGAGVASYSRTFTIEPRFTALRDKSSRSRARKVDASEGRVDVPELYDRWRAVTPGALSRTDGWWADYLEDRITQREGGSALNFIVHPDGFLSYRTVGANPHAFRRPFGSLHVQDFCPITPDAHTDLLGALVSMNMFDDIVIDIAVDDPLPLKLKDPLAARQTGGCDFLWLRIMDVPTVLSAREYSADADLVLEITDPLTVAGGRFRLQIRNGAATCTPHEGPADVKMALGDLGTLFMGAHRAWELHSANRITELQSGALKRLDAAFTTTRAPFSGTLY
jgi:predicted acetyltransferase